MNSLVCPHCQYENVVVTCGFCLQCGIDLDVEDTGISESLSQNANRIKPPAQTLAEAVSEQLSGTLVADADTWAVRISLAGDRNQVVHFADDPANKLVVIFSICGPAVERNAFPLITWNGQLEDCYFAARDIHGKKLFVLTGRERLDGTATAAAILLAHRLGKLADSVEAKISAGADQH